MAIVLFFSLLALLIFLAGKLMTLSPYPVCMVWDKQLNELMDKGLDSVDSYGSWAHFSGIDVWVDPTIGYGMCARPSKRVNPTKKTQDRLYKMVEAYKNAKIEQAIKGRVAK